MVDRRLARLALTLKLPLAVCVAAGLAVLAAAALTGFASARLVAGVVSSGTVAGAWNDAALAAAGVVTMVVASVARELAAARLGHRVRRRLLETGFRRLLELGPSHRLADPGRATPLLVDGPQAIQAYVSLYVTQIVVSVVGPAALVLVLVALDWVVGLVVALAVLAVPLVRPLWRRALGERGARQWAAYRELSERTLETLQGMPTLVLLGSDRDERRSYARRAGELHGATVANLKTSMGVYLVIALATGIGTAVATGVGALRLEAGALTAQGLLVVLFLTSECFRPLVDLQHHWHAGFRGLAAADGLEQLQAAVPPVVDGAAGHGPPPAPASVELEHVTVRYPGAAVAALDDVSLRVPAGAGVAILGPSGAGKTTLLNLLQRWLDPDEGRVLIGDHDAATLPLATLRTTVAAVTQDVLLFPGTIADNLRIAAPAATDAELWQALDDAALGDGVRGLPHGLDTVLAERGSSWSGGQRQRLAIARALLADAAVLVLDEATAFLDGASEAEVVATVDRLRGDRTVILVTHRPATALGCDEVVVLQAGRIAERGVPNDLLAAETRFAALVAASGGAA